MEGQIWVAWPLACLAAGALLVALVARVVTRSNGWLAGVTAVAFAAGLAATGVAATRAVAWQAETGAWPMWGSLAPGGAQLRAEPGSLLLMGVAMAMGLLVALYSGRYLSLDQRYMTYYPLLLLLVIGLSGVLMAADLFTLFLACELMGIASYVLVAFRRHTDTSIEAGFKYLVMSSAGTMTMLMGVALVYRASGTLCLPQASVDSVWARAGLACLATGLCVKVGIVPVHTWLPDAQGRAPSSISAMLAGAVEGGALYALLKVCLGLGVAAEALGTLLVVAALVNMCVGNLMALRQTYTKRLLAYSTIAQMGYIMLAIGVGLRHGVAAAVQAGFFMMLAHSAMKGLAFLSKGAFHYGCGVTRMEQLRGVARSLPLVSACMVVAVVGLIGVPPLAGFAGKWLVLAEVLRAADWLAVVGAVVFVANVVLSLGYYLPLVATLFAQPETPPTRMRLSGWMAVPLVVLAGLVLAMGAHPDPWLRLTAGVGPYLLSLTR